MTSLKLQTIHFSLTRAFSLLLLAFVTFSARDGVAAQAELRALLIGVSAYGSSSGLEPLKGPKNDVALLKDVLLGRGFSERNIVMLAERPDANGRPTRAAILGELDRLAEVAGRDDIIVIHFSGHGSQLPNDNFEQDPEVDGQDEILLPADVGRYDYAS